MKAIILTAGVGSRFLPHTNTLPECPIKVSGSRLIDMLIASIKK